MLRAKIDEQTYPVTSGLKFIDDLRTVRRDQGANSFQLDHDVTEAEKICSVLAPERAAFVAND